MVDLVLRSEKGTELTWSELDGNFVDISDAIDTLISQLDSKQATLVSGSNIKTINGASVLGSGNLVISGGGGTVANVWFDPMDYGAIGDGIADDTIPLNDAAAAAAAAGGALRLTPGKTFSFTTLYISDNVKCVFGYGSVLKQRSSGITRGVVLQGIANGQATNVRNCALLGFTVDCNNLQSNGVSCNNASNLLIKDVEIRNGFNGAGILIKAYSSGGEDSLRISIANCRVAGRIDGSSLYSGILVEGENTSDAVTYWKANFAPVPSTRKPVSITISACEVVGGYFGIKVEQAAGLVINSNRVLYTKDAIRLQDGVVNASLSSNVCSEFTNSGISAWRGCSNINVADNVFGSSVCNGDGPMFFVACRTLKTSGNSTNMLGSSPLYHLYVGPGCSDNDHSSNMVYGNASKAYICVESDWSSSTSEPASYSFGATSALNNYVNAAMLATRFVGNTLFPLSASAHGIAMLQTATQGMRAVAIDNSFFSNSTNNKALYLYENVTNELRSCVLTANKFHPGANDSKFTLPRGKAHFSLFNSNAFLDSNLFFAPTVNNSPTPDVGLHSYISLAAYSTPTNVTDFANGFDGQEIVVRLSVNATLIHNASLLALKGDVNVTGPGALKMIAFKRNSNVWFETWRNF